MVRKFFLLLVVCFSVTVAPLQDDAHADARVAAVQRMLTTLGYDPGPADGVWGRRTTRAARAFVHSRSISPSRIFGSDGVNISAVGVNISLLVRELRVAVANLSTNTGGAVHVGVSRRDIRRIEELLRQVGYDPGPVDGVWNSRTAVAVDRFARSIGLSERAWRTGRLVKAYVLIGRLRRAASSREEAPQTAQSDFGATQDLGTLHVLRIERRLMELGFDPGPLDGTWDSRTMDASRRFGRAHNVDIATWLTAGRVDSRALIRQLTAAENSQTNAGAQQVAGTGSSEGGISGSTSPDELTQVIQAGATALLEADYAVAVAQFTRAIELDPGQPEHYGYRGRAYLAGGNTARAFDDFNNALRLNDAYTAGYAYRAAAYERRGNYARALEDRAAALRLEPDNAQFQAALAQTAQRLAASSSAATQDDSGQALAAPALGSERRIALVVGNSRYQHAPSLRNPAGDARAMADAFERLGFSDVTLEFDLDRDALAAALRAFTDQAVSADWAVIYFAGHGFEIDGVNYLVPVDAKLERDAHVRWETVSLDDVLGAMSGARKLRLAILDACRNNPFTSRMQMSGTRSVGRGLGLIEPEGGTLVAYAARHGQVALDGDGANSPYVNALLRHLNTEKLEIGLMFRRVRDTVRQLTARSQEPYVYGSLPSEELYFNPDGG